MKITRTSVLSGNTHTMDIDVTEAQMATYKAGGVTLQETFPNLTADEREFIKTGITPEEWEATFPPEEEDEEDYDEEDYDLELNFEAYQDQQDALEEDNSDW